MSPAHRSEGAEGELRIERRSRGGAKSDDKEGEVRSGDDGTGASDTIALSTTTTTFDEGDGVASLSTLMNDGDGTVTDTAVCIGIADHCERARGWRRCTSKKARFLWPGIDVFLSPF